MSEYLVDQATSGLDPDAVRRFAVELQEFVSRVRANLEAQRSGIGVAPAYRRPFPLQLEAEAERRDALRDPTAEAWRALAESVRLARACAEICRGLGVSFE